MSPGSLAGIVISVMSVSVAIFFQFIRNEVIKLQNQLDRTKALREDYELQVRLLRKENEELRATLAEVKPYR
jgi:capsule polysaccharide export protein KpsE/RkpR